MLVLFKTLRERSRERYRQRSRKSSYHRMEKKSIITLSEKHYRIFFVIYHKLKEINLYIITYFSLIFLFTSLFFYDILIYECSSQFSFVMKSRLQDSTA